MVPPRGFEDNEVSGRNTETNKNVDSEGWTDGGISPENLLIQVVQRWSTLSPDAYKRIKAILDEPHDEASSA
jgi:hypothetical protein